MSQMHPLISPFTSFYAQQSRLLRFHAYIAQLELYCLATFAFYVGAYRKADPLRNADVLDQADIMAVLGGILLGSLLLTPWLSEPLLALCSDTLVPSSERVMEPERQTMVLKKRRAPLRYLLHALVALLTVGLPIWASAHGAHVPASSQYCMSTTVVGAVFGATLGPNLLYLWANAAFARKVAYASTKKQAGCAALVAHPRALQILRDMRAVTNVKDQFTLADVLPSSLECSERELSSSQHRSS